MQREEILQALRDTKTIQSGHFILSSGLHSKEYVEKFRLLEQPRLLQKLCVAMAEPYLERGISTVIGPATGGILLAHCIGAILGARAIFTERVEGAMTFRRGFSLDQHERVLMVEDVITTGASIRETIAATLSQFPETIIEGIAALIQRSGKSTPDFGYAFSPLLKLSDIESFPAESCPMCLQGMKAEKPGSTNKGG